MTLKRISKKKILIVNFILTVSRENQFLYVYIREIVFENKRNLTLSHEEPYKGIQDKLDNAWVNCTDFGQTWSKRPWWLCKS